ncbi:hypothetical protein FKG94_15720 [Exilibacterium tricleocarpae]|uniref:Lipoprotein n=1 Tax=Exilibacterium tricleocarpae TaxID=2591008 RepID=A0A545TFU9_9GAMM|nr:hypothetical protein [Exilibacterium tricleocarpae]TQV76056.1 hypothetical protein FKG94_15720 [Exilibacterium tricleocarpae]
MIKRICLTGLTALAVGCSSPDHYTPETTGNGQMGVILGPAVNGQKSNTRWVNTVTAIDGRRVADPLADIDMAPGRYRLTLNCKKSKKLSLDATVELEVAAGVHYQVAVDHNRQRCVIVRSRVNGRAASTAG